MIVRAAIFLAGFILGSVLEIQVEAAERVQLRRVDLAPPSVDAAEPATKPRTVDIKGLLQEPAGCLAKTDTCAVQVGPRRMLKLESGAGRLWTVGDMAIVVRESKERLRLIEGVLRLQGELTTVVVESASILAKGEVYIERFDSGVKIINVGDSDVEIRRRGFSAPERLGPGFEVELAKPSVQTGVTSVNSPMPFDFESQVVREAKFFEGSKDEFQTALVQLLAKQRATVAIAAQLHEEKVHRKIASLQHEAEQKRLARQKEEVENRRIRALFRKRVLEPDED